MYGNEASVRHIFTLPVVHNTRFHVQSSRFLLTRNRCSVFLARFFRLLPSNSPFFFSFFDDIPHTYPIVSIRIPIVIFTWNHPIFRLALVSFHAIGFLAIEMEWFHYSSRNYSLGPDTRLSSFSFSRFIKFIAVSLSPLFSLFSHDSVGISGNDSRSNVIGCTVSISCIVL